VEVLSPRRYQQNLGTQRDNQTWDHADILGVLLTVLQLSEGMRPRQAEALAIFGVPEYGSVLFDSDGSMIKNPVLSQQARTSAYLEIHPHRSKLRKSALGRSGSEKIGCKSQILRELRKWIRNQ
jgi:hypothetical protein